MIHGEAAAINVDSTTPNIRAAVGNRAITQFQSSLRINLDCAARERMMALREGQLIDYHLSVYFKNLLIRDAISIGIAAYGEQVSTRPIKDNIIIQDQVLLQVDGRRVIGQAG